MDDGVRVLIISRNSESRQLYESFINNAGVPFDPVDSLQDAMFSATRNAYNGIVIDLQTLLQANDKEKEYIQDMLKAYPVAKVRAVPSRNNISIICAGKCRAGNATIDDFISKECLKFKARPFRSTERKNINLPVVLSSSSGFIAEETEKTFTVNISFGGFFIFTSRRWNIGEKVWIKLQSPADDMVPITGEVRWGIDWGEKSVIPGIGVHFTQISEEQQKVIFLAMH